MSNEEQKQLDLGESSEATAIAPVRKPAPPKREPKHLPPFKVLLHNDDVNTFEHVIRSILRLTPIDAEGAIEKTIEAHETGVALLLMTHQERAELYVDQFASVGIVVTTEPDAA